MARVPNDPNVLSRLSQLHLLTSEDTQEALHYQLESFRNYPVDLDVLSWLGSYFVKNELYEKSIYFFRQAQLVQPNEVKWGMMTASALRRIDDDEGALREYETLHQRFPDNTDVSVSQQISQSQFVFVIFVTSQILLCCHSILFQASKILQLYVRNSSLKRPEC